MRDDPINTFPGTVVELRRARVYVREAWDDDWEETPYLYCDRIVERMGQPTQFALSYHAGEIKREDSSRFVNFVPANIVGWFVKVALDPIDPDDEDEEPVRWYGEIVSDARRVYSGLGTQERAIDQSFMALGLEHRLANSQVRGSAVRASTRIDTPLVWNRSPEIGPGDQKNLFISDSLGGNEYLFDWSLPADERELWHVDDAIAYLLQKFSAPLFDEVRIRPPASGGVMTFLASTLAPSVEMEGQSVLSLLNYLLRPARGVGWRLAYDDDADEGGAAPIIEVFSLVEADVTVAGATLPANAEQTSIDVTGLHGVIDLVLVEDSSQRYSAIVAQGERVLSCFSLSKADTSFDKAWTDAQKTAYDSNATSTDDERAKNDRKRQGMVVYSRFAVPAAWDQKAGNGAGGTKTTINPLIEENGEFHATAGGPMRPGAWGMLFEPWIPLKEEGLENDDRVYFRRAMAFVKDPLAGTPAKYLDVQRHTRTDEPHGDLTPLDDALGFEVRFEPPHVLGLGQFTETKTLFPPRFDWRDMIVTGAVRLDQRCSVEHELEDNPNGPKLYIDVPGAELWIVNSGTVIGLEPDGQPKRYTGDRVVRDDRAKLKSELAMAVAYYGVRRRGMSLTLAGLATGAKIGGFITVVKETVGSRTDEAPVNAAVLERHFDFENITTTIVAGPLRPTFGGGGGQ